MPEKRKSSCKFTIEQEEEIIRRYNNGESLENMEIQIGKKKGK